MSEEVIFKITEGSLAGEEFVFEEKGSYLIGRSAACALQIPNTKDMRISRRHLLLIIDPPYVRIRDLGSRNGTIVNGELLKAGEISDEPEKMTPSDRILKPGDVVSIGDTTLTVLVSSEESSEDIAQKHKVPQVIPVLQTAMPVRSKPGSVTQLAPVTHTALPVTEKTAPTVTEATPPLKQKKSAPVKSQDSSSVTSKTESVPAVDKLKLQDAKVDKYEQMKARALKQKLDSNLPTVEMDVQEFEDMDDLVFQPEHPTEEKKKKRTTKFKIKGPN